jgi:hypothetical protein
MDTDKVSMMLSGVSFTTNETGIAYLKIVNYCKDSPTYNLGHLSRLYDYLRSMMDITYKDQRAILSMKVEQLNSTLSNALDEYFPGKNLPWH